jgi:effector-binding domain-containing protein
MPSYQIERSILIDAPPERVYDVVSDFGTWTTWSPWLIVEPDAKVTVSDNANSVGSTYAWQGTITGEGKMEHKRLQPNELIESDLWFIKPFKSHCDIRFKLSPSGSGTKLTWTMDGSMPWFLFFMVPMIKTFIGMDYQRGLAMIKDWIETGSIPSKSVVHGIESIEPIRMAGIAASCLVSEVGKSMEAAFAKAESEFKRLRLPTTGPMISVYTKFNIKQGVFDYIAGYIIPNDAKVDSSSQLKVWSLPASKAFRVEHIGSYHHLGNAWSIANQLVRHKKLKQQRTGTLEIYRTTPDQVSETECKTDIYLPLR